MRTNVPSRLEVEINRQEPQFSFPVGDRFVYRNSGQPMYPRSRALGWPGASRPGKGQLSTRCQSTPPRVPTSGAVGIRPV